LDWHSPSFHLADCLVMAWKYKLRPSARRAKNHDKLILELDRKNEAAAVSCYIVPQASESGRSFLLFRIL